MTALEIEKRQFEKSLRGYNTDEVNRFLSNLAAEWDRMSNEHNMLKLQLEILEKEASKLKEVESTLIKTLRTAEEASSKIEESARIDAEKKLAEANNIAKTTVADAQNQAEEIIKEAQQKAKGIEHAAKVEYQEYEEKFSKLESRKSSLIAQFEEIAREAGQLAKSTQNEIEIVQIESPNPTVEPKVTVVEKINEPVAEENEISFPSVANQLSEDTLKTEDDLTIIEGVGPKIFEIFKAAGLDSFSKVAASTQIDLKNVLESQGQYMHDPTTWPKQAALAAEAKWAELEDLKKELVAGKAPKSGLSGIMANPKAKESTDIMRANVQKVRDAVRKYSNGTEKPAESQPRTLEDTAEKIKKSEEVKSSKSFFDSLDL
jgi:DivIVA domain-containing protein